MTNRETMRGNEIEQQNTEQQNETESFLLLGLEKGEKINEGNNGVIFQIDLKDFHPLTIKHVFPEITDEDLLAIKALKIYQHGAIEREADYQKRAYEANGGNTDPQSAKIPRPISCRELHIDLESLKSKLKKSGIANPEMVSVMLMDYVPGDDLATYFYKKLLAVIPSKKGMVDKENLDLLPFDQLEEDFCEALNLTVPTPEQKARGVDIIWIDKNNQEIIERKLEKYDIAFDPKIFDRLTRTLNKLHKAGLYHNDIHERNIKFILDEQGKLIDVYLIDFGLANERQEEGDSDFDTIHRYERLTLSKAEREKQKLEELKHSFKIARETFLKNPSNASDFRLYREDLKEVVESNNPKKVAEKIISILSFSGNNYDLVGGLLQPLFKENESLLIDSLRNVVSLSKLGRPQFWLDLIKFFRAKN